MRIKNMFLCFDVLPAEKTGIDGPCTWPDHSCSSAERRQHYRNPGITDVAQSNPQLDGGDQSSRPLVSTGQPGEVYRRMRQRLAESLTVETDVAVEADDSKAHEHGAS